MKEGENKSYETIYEQIYTRWRKYNSGLWSKAALGQASHFPSAQLLAA